MKETAHEEIEKDAENYYYWVNVICTNCGLRKCLAFRKGVTISQHNCPNCKVESLQKV